MSVSDIDWVVFDLGGVVLRATDALGALAAALGAEDEGFAAAYYPPRADYDRDSDADRYFRAIASACGAPVPSSALISDLVRLDDNGWSTVNPATLALIVDLAAAGPRLAVLSNAPSSMGRLIEIADWAEAFDHMLFSGDLGVSKPDEMIYRLLLARLDTPAERTVFLDDRADNVAGARAVGMAAIEFRNAGQARRELRAVGLPV